jgi:hypothetical protein
MIKTPWAFFVQIGNPENEEFLLFEILLDRGPRIG